MKTAKTKTTEEAQIETMLEAWTNAMRAKDADKVVSHYTADSVLFDLAPPLQFTSAQAFGKQALEEWFATWNGSLGYELRDLKITAGAEVAFSHCLIRLSGTKTDGVKVDMWQRTTLGFRQFDGQWKIAHQHESVPFYMDGSFKAAVDLKP